MPSTLIGRGQFILKMEQLYKIKLRKCYVCKKVLPLTKIYFPNHRKEYMGLAYYCKKCGPLRKPYKYSEYKIGAKRRNIDFSITKKQFEYFWQKSCYYCGKKIKSIGLDRVNNLRGYSIKNIVSCCKICNKMKGKMSKKEFINKCRVIAKKF